MWQEPLEGNPGGFLVKIREIVVSYEKRGLNEKEAEAHAAADIFLSKLGSSKMVDHVALKGGMLMYNLTKSARRATTDLDFDFLRYSIDDESIRLFIQKLNMISDGVKVSTVGAFLPLKHLDYRGKRVFICLSDVTASLTIKLDIGVHTYLSIPQKHMVFSCLSSEKGVVLLANPNEQIFVEKIVSLAKWGPVSTRYKDIYDLYYLVHEQLLNLNDTKRCLALFLASGHYPFSSALEIYQRIDATFSDPQFSLDASKPNVNWIEVSYSVASATILDFLFSLI